MEKAKTAARIRAERGSQKRILTENRIWEHLQLEKRNAISHFVATWQEKSQSILAKSGAKRNTETISEELKTSNKQLLQLRRTELRKLIKEDFIMYERELAKVGLAIGIERL